MDLSRRFAFCDSAISGTPLSEAESELSYLLRCFFEDSVVAIKLRDSLHDCADSSLTSAGEDMVSSPRPLADREADQSYW